MNKLFAFAFGVVVQAHCFSYAIAAPVVVNGSFEDVQIGAPYISTDPNDIPGWLQSSTDGGFGDALLWGVGYSDGGGRITAAGAGNQFVTLGCGFSNATCGMSIWETTITGLSAGSSYVLGFLLANETNPSIVIGQSITVDFVDGSNTSDQTFTVLTPSTAAYWQTWVSQSMTFVATGPSTTVNFYTFNQRADIGLDNVTVTAVPEPASILLVFAAGLAGIATRKKSTPA